MKKRIPGMLDGTFGAKLYDSLWKDTPAWMREELYKVDEELKKGSCAIKIILRSGKGIT